MTHHLNFMLQKLLREEREQRDEARATRLETFVIPKNLKELDSNKRLGMPYIAIQYRIDALKREYRMLRGREYGQEGK